MADYKYVTLDVFTEQRFGGNPLAVVLEAQGLSDAQMQAIAREFNYSETTFVLPPQDPRHTARVRIFTPAYELPFAGHPNVGTAYALAQLAETPPQHFVPEHYVFEELAGLVRVHLQRDAAGVVVQARVAAPVSLQIDIEVPIAHVAACAGLTDADFLTNAHGPLVASVGTPFAIAEVTDLAALARAAPDRAAFAAANAALKELGRPLALLLYVRRDGSATHLRSRMFAPLGGSWEDPATGSANATLAALLTSLAPGENVSLDFEIEQGIEMGRPSLLRASGHKTAEGPVNASVAGACVAGMRGWRTV